MLTRDRDLETALQRDPDDATARLVYADWLQAHGHPLGELIAVEHKREATPSGHPISEAIAFANSGCAPPEDFVPPPEWQTARELEQRAARILEEHAAELLGPLATPGDAKVSLQWRRGFIHTARFAWDFFENDRAPSPVPALVEALLDLPAGLLVRELTFGLHVGDEGQGHYQELIDAVARRPRPALGYLHVGDYHYNGAETEISWSHLGHLGALWAALPGLEHLELQGGTLDLGEVTGAPSLRRLVIRSGGLAASVPAAIGAASWPRLEELSLWLGDPNYGGDADLGSLRGILEGAGLPSLRRLALANCSFADEICSVLADAPVLRRLETLDLSRGVMTDAGARALLARRAAFAHLQQLDVRRNYLTSPESLASLCPSVNASDQRQPYGDTDRRYVDVGE